MEETIALASARIGRSSVVPGVEVTIAGPERRHFPPRLSDALGLCLKTGPVHEVIVNGRELSYPADALCVRLPGCVWECRTETAAFVSIDIPPSFVPEAAPAAPAMRFARGDVLPQFARQAQRLLVADSALLAEQMLTELIARVQQLGGVELAVGSRRRSAVPRARDFIHAAFGSRLDLETIAQAAGLNKFSLVRQFRERLGTTPHSYVVMLRVNRARELLADGVRPADAAIECGFADQAHLTRWFLRVTGVTPAVYTRRVDRGEIVNFLQDEPSPTC